MQPAKQTAEAAVEDKQEVSSFNLNLSLQAWFELTAKDYSMDLSFLCSLGTLTLQSGQRGACIVDQRWTLVQGKCDSCFVISSIFVGMLKFYHLVTSASAVSITSWIILFGEKCSEV